MRKLAKTPAKKAPSKVAKKAMDDDKKRSKEKAYEIEGAELVKVKQVEMAAEEPSEAVVSVHIA